MIIFALAKFFIVVIGAFFGCLFFFFGLLCLLTPQDIANYGKRDGLMASQCGLAIVPNSYALPVDLECRIDLMFSQRLARYLLLLFMLAYIAIVILAAYLLFGGGL